MASEANALLKDCLNTERGSSQYVKNVAAIVEDVRKGSVALISLVVSLESSLTSNNEGQRSRGVSLLAEIVKSLGDVLKDDEQQVLAEFFSSKLSDWSSLSGGLEGCLSILQCNSVSDTVALSIAQAFIAEVVVPHTKQADRHVALQLFLILLKEHGVQLAGNEIDLVEVTISCIDGEKDPRCLLLAFESVQNVVALYSMDGVDSDPLVDNCEDLFDVISCYFPLSFSPPPNESDGVARQDLVDALHATLACSHHFAQFCIPLLLEKLSSSLSSAKEDSLLLLVTCCDSFGWQCMAEYLPAIWSTIQPLVLPKTGLTHDFDEIDENNDSLKDDAGKSIQKCIRALRKDEDSAGCEGLDDLILQEPCIQDVIASVVSHGNIEQLTSATDTIRRVTWLLEMVAGSVPEVCQRVFSVVVTPLLAHMQGNELHTAKFQVISWICLRLTHAIRTSAHEASWPIPSILHELATMKSLLDQQQGAMNGLDENLNAFPAPHSVCGKVRMELCCLPEHWNFMPKNEWDATVLDMLNATPSPENDACSRVDSSSSCEALRELCACGYEQQLTDLCITPLVGLVMEGSAKWPGAMQCIKTLAEVSVASQSQLLVELEKRLKGVLEENPDLDALQDVLSALFDFIGMELISTNSKESLEGERSAVMVQLAQIILEWGNRKEMTIGSNLLVSCGRMLNRLVAACPQSNQRDIVAHIQKIATSHDAQVLQFCCIIGLRKDVLSWQESIHYLQYCAQLCMETSNPLQTVSAVTVASLTNKLPDHNPENDCTWVHFVTRLCEETLFPNLCTDNTTAALQCIGMVLRGVAMRGKGQAIESLIMQMLSTLMTGDETMIQSSVCEIFEVCLVDNGTETDMVYLDGRVHACRRPLWRQRMFTQCMEFVSRIDAEYRSQYGKVLPTHCLAFAHLFRGAGPGLVRLEAERALPRVIEVIDFLLENPSLGVELQASTVALLEGLVTDEGLIQLCRSQLKNMMDSMLSCCVWPHSLYVRQAALRCLIALQKVANGQSNVYRKQVLKKVQDCLDDNKRCVRSIAVKCRLVWERAN